MAKEKEATKKKTKKGQETKTQAKKKVQKQEKKSLGIRIRTFFAGLKKEFKRIHFPSKKELIKYSIATFLFIVFFALFFYLITDVAPKGLGELIENFK